MVDSIVAARENGSKFGYAVGPNRELVALGMCAPTRVYCAADLSGAANLVSSCMVGTGSIPIFGSITRTYQAVASCLRPASSLRPGSRLNGATGARTQIASAITACIMIGSIFLLPWLYFLPKVCQT
jgi:MFS superfamily sulfate permease-like transporter